MSRQCTWTLRVGDHTLNLKYCSLLRDFCDKFTCVDDVVHLSSVLEASKVCSGNKDERFKALSESHKGVFKDRRGIYSTV